MLRIAWFGLLVCLCIPSPASGQSLRGSRASLDRQNEVASQHDFTILGTPQRVQRFASLGYLVRVSGNRNFRLHNVSYPFARPEVNLFVRRLAGQYRGACGEQLVVTSLTRPTNRQPGNASRRSVHPAGMAIDLRISNVRACRVWLEGVLLRLEGAGILEATRERRPPHYHIAVFPTQYAQYVARITGQVPVRRAVRTTVTSPPAQTSRATHGDTVYHRVDRGHNLTTVARRYGVTISAVRETNNLSSSRINAGQTLKIPAISHRVKSGETLSGIAEKYGAPIDLIQRVNGRRSTRIMAGEVLIIPLV